MLTLTPIDMLENAVVPLMAERVRSLENTRAKTIAEIEIIHGAGTGAGDAPVGIENENVSDPRKVRRQAGAQQPAGVAESCTRQIDLRARFQDGLDR